MVHHHVDSVKHRETEITTNDQDQDLQNYDFDGPTSESTSDDQTPNPSELVTSRPASIEANTNEASELLAGLRRSTRIRRPPQRYGQPDSNSGT